MRPVRWLLPTVAAMTLGSVVLPAENAAAAVSPTFAPQSSANDNPALQRAYYGYRYYDYYGYGYYPRYYGYRHYYRHRYYRRRSPL
jgi:hypothetical protein